MGRLIETIKNQWRVILITSVVTLVIVFGVWGGEKFLSSTPF